MRAATRSMPVKVEVSCMPFFFIINCITKIFAFYCHSCYFVPEECCCGLQILLFSLGWTANPAQREQQGDTIVVYVLQHSCHFSSRRKLSRILSVVFFRCGWYKFTIPNFLIPIKKINRIKKNVAVLS